MVTHKSILFLAIIMIFLGCEKEDNLSNPDNKEKMKSYGKIICNSKPNGAKVYLDTLDTGLITPTIIDSVEVGFHQVRLSKKYFNDYSESFNVTKDKYYGVNIRLTQNIYRSNYFPLYVGSFWKYIKYNNTAQSMDTLVYKILDIVDLKSIGPAAIWIKEIKRTQAHYRFSDTNYIKIENDTVKLYANAYMIRPSKIIPFPLVLHKTWIGNSNIGLGGAVIGTDSLSIKTSIKYFCYKIEYNTGDPITNEAAFEEWLSSQVGYVRIIDWPILQSQYWDLDSYFIAYD